MVGGTGSCGAALLLKRSLNYIFGLVPGRRRKEGGIEGRPDSGYIHIQIFFVMPSRLDAQCQPPDTIRVASLAFPRERKLDGRN